MFKNILLIIILSNNVNLFAQKCKENTLLTKQGLLIFEGKGNVFNMYFIETSMNQLSQLFNKIDTIKVIQIGTPGDNANNVIGYKEYLGKIFTFDTLSCITIIDDNGLYIEDTCSIKYKRGLIKYTKSKAYKLKERYEKRKINGRVIFYEIGEFIPIISFKRNYALCKGKT